MLYLTESQVEAEIVRLITDAFNGQNTAEIVRQALTLITQNYLPRDEAAALSGGGGTVTVRLFESLTAAQAKAVDGVSVKQGMNYDIDFGNNVAGKKQIVNTVGLKNNRFSPLGVLNVDGKLSLIRYFPQAPAFTPGIPPNEVASLEKSVTFFLEADSLADPYGRGWFGQLDFSLCCRGTRVFVEFYRENQNEPFRNQYLVCVFDGSATPFTPVIYRDGFFKPGETVPGKFVKESDPESTVRRYYPSLTDIRVGEILLFDLNGITSFAKAKQAGQLPAPTGYSDAYWEPATRPAPSAGLKQRIYLTLLQAQDLINNSRVEPGQPYQVDISQPNYPGSLLINGGQDSDYFEEEALLIDASGQQAGRVKANIALGTYQAVSYGGSGSSVSADGLTIIDNNGVFSAAVRNDIVFRATQGGAQTSGPFIVSRLDAGIYTASANSGINYYDIYVNNLKLTTQSFVLAENDTVKVDFGAQVSGGIITLRS